MRKGLPLSKIRGGEKLYLKVCENAKCGLADYYSGSAIRCPKCEHPIRYAPKPKKKSKFHAVRSIDTEGRAYPSKLERDRAMQLQALQAAGEISNLKYQQTVTLLNTPLGRISLCTDFEYEKDGVMHWEDSKGVGTPRWRMLRQIWSLCGPGPLVVSKRKGRKAIEVVETIWPEKPSGHVVQLELPDSAISMDENQTDRSARG